MTRDRKRRALFGADYTTAVALKTTSGKARAGGRTENPSACLLHWIHLHN